MIDCNRIWVNHDLHYTLLDKIHCSDQWHGPLELIGKGTVGKCYKTIINLDVPHLLPYYIIKSQPISAQSNREKHFLRLISDDLLLGTAPLIFPFLYLSYTCENDMNFVLQPADISLQSILEKFTPNNGWWANFLYQLSKGIYYLEERKINHNDLTFDNLLFQYISADYQDFVIMLIDFGSAVLDDTKHSGLPPFIQGRDLNYFLYTLIYHGVPNGYFPQDLANKLHPFIEWEKYKPQPNEHPYFYGLRRANIIKHNWKTSGKNISRFLASEYPTVTDRCTVERLNKLHGVALGAIVGDAFGVPVQSDPGSTIIDKMYPSGVFQGLLSHENLPAGTFTDGTQMALALIDAIFDQNRRIIPSAVAKYFKLWANSDPINIEQQTQIVLSQISDSGNNWKQVSHSEYLKKPNSASNGVAIRTWPIAIFHHNDHYSKVVDSVVKQAQTTHMNSDSVYSAVFISILIHKLINGGSLNQSISDSLKMIEKFVSIELQTAMKNGHKVQYKRLNGGTGWIVHTMTVVMWAIRNTTTFREAILAAANVRGDASANTSITGAIAGALYGANNIPVDWLKAISESPANIWGGKPLDVNRIRDLASTLANC